MSSDKTSNLFAFISKIFIENRSTILFNTSLQSDQQHLTAEIQNENKKLKFNIIKRLRLKTKGKRRINNDLNSINLLFMIISFTKSIH